MNPDRFLIGQITQLGFGELVGQFERNRFGVRHNPFIFQQPARIRIDETQAAVDRGNQVRIALGRGRIVGLGEKWFLGIEAEDIGQAIFTQEIKKTDTGGDECLDRSLLGGPVKGRVAFEKNDMGFGDDRPHHFFGIAPLDNADNQTGGLLQGSNGLHTGVGKQVVVNFMDRPGIVQK